MREATGGEGVDVVLNALAGPFIPASLALLRPQGRFIEIGKRDLIAGTALDLSPFLRNLTFAAFDLGQIVDARDPMLTTMLETLLDRFASGELQALPTEVVPFEQALDGSAAWRAPSYRQDRLRGQRGRDGARRGPARVQRRGLPATASRSTSGSTSSAACCRGRTRRPTCSRWARRSRRGVLHIRRVVEKGSPGAPASRRAVPRAGGRRRDRAARLWEDAWHLADRRRRRLYVELGGDSIEAIQIQHAIHREFDLRVKTPSFFPSRRSRRSRLIDVAPDVERADRQRRRNGRARVTHGGQLASLMMNVAAPLMCRLTSRGATPALDFVPSMGTTPLSLVRLARAIAPERLVRSYAYRGIEDDAPAHSTIEAIAEANVAELRAAAPHGPYLIAGHCLGGAVAFAMASALEASGERVAAIVMIDAMAPIPADRPRFDPDVRVVDGGRISARSRSSCRCAIETWRTRAGGASGVPGSPRRSVRPRRSHAGALRRLRWRRTVDGNGAAPMLKRHPVPGDTLSMLRPPHVEAVGRVLRRLLHRPCDARAAPAITRRSSRLATRSGGVARLWEEGPAPRAAAPTTFFDLGGESLQAFALIEASTTRSPCG